MNGAERSLHYVVEKWLAPASQTCIRVIAFGHIREDKRRYVHVEVTAANRAHAIFFFRHDDGNWYVFPPAMVRPSMNAQLV